MTDFSAYKDKDLSVLLKGGNAYAYTEIFERYTPVLVSHAFRLLGNEDEANDVVQDVFMALWQKRDVIEFTTSLSAYLYTAIRNRIINQISHQKVVARYAGSIIQHMAGEYNTADEQLREKELAAVIEREIEALPAKMREVFLLHKKQEMSYKDIAQQLNITDGTAKQQVYNALKILKNKVKAVLIFFFL